jgi:hypothetical protein
MQEPAKKAELLKLLHQWRANLDASGMKPNPDYDATTYPK